MRRTDSPTLLHISPSIADNTAVARTSLKLLPSKTALWVGVALAALSCAQVNANTLSGVVQDNQGQPIANAKVQLVGSKQQVLTDAQGRFVLNTASAAVNEIHIEAKNFAHKNQHFTVPEQGLSNVTIALAPSVIEVIDVTASPLHTSLTESASPVSVLAGDALRLQQSATLGDTLQYQVGVHSNFHGSVASSPIIRGLDGPRVLISQNGLDAGDASRVGPDHSIASEAGTAQQIEVLRGPATLFYGSGAIGGVVNVVDERVPTTADRKAAWQLEHATVNQAQAASLAAQGGVLELPQGELAVYADGFFRQQQNYKIPGIANNPAKPDDVAGGRVANSDAISRGGTVGASYVMPQGYVGLSVGRLTRQYGIPGHSHDHDHDHDDHSGDAADDHAHHAGEEPRVYADLAQNRYQLHSSLNFDGVLQTVNTRLGYTDYAHAEIEDGMTGTTFSNQSEEFRLELLHREFDDWRGGLSVHYKASDFAAVGDEAFTPPSDSKSYALAWMEEKHFGPVLLQFGARTERVKLQAPTVLLPEIELHATGHDHGHDNHDHHDSHQLIRRFAVSQQFSPFSLSTGAVWEYQPGYNLAIALSRSGRAPAAAELLSFGPHIGTSAYEVGALFRYQANGTAPKIELNPHAIDLETANNIDLTWRKLHGDVAIVLNGFYNQIDNYYYQAATGMAASVSHDSADGHQHVAELPLYITTAADAILHGAEAQLVWQFAPQWRWQQQLDWVRARLVDGGDLPRTPPLRYSSTLSWQSEPWLADVRFTALQRQDQVAAFEQATAGYGLIDASLSYFFDWQGQALSVYAKGNNLSDRDVRVHTSFLKDKTPLPGRSFSLGIRGEF